MKTVNLSILKFLLLFFLGCNLTIAAPFECEKNFSDSLQVEQVTACNSAYVGGILPAKTIDKRNFNNQLYNQVLHKNNVGGIKIKLPNKSSKVVYRSSYLVGAPICLSNLQKLGVNTIVNLYSGKLGYAKKLAPLEQKMSKVNNIKNYIHIQGYGFDDLKLTSKKLNLKIASIIKQIVTVKGNVLIHCYTGEHDTGIIFGVLNKCYNKQSLSSIDKDTMCHMGDRTNYQQVTYKRVIDIVKQFPCELLKSTK